MLANTAKFGSGLRWPNTVFDTCVSFTFFSKTIDPFIIKNGSRQVNNTNLHVHLSFDSLADVCAIT